MSANLDSVAIRRSNREVYAGVIRALALRDMRTRFGGSSFWGYVILVMWPVTHVFILVAVMGFRGMAAPVGDSPLVFVATGALPVLMALYTSNETMKAIVMNKPLLYYPQVKIYDIMIARFIVEIIKNFTGLIIVALIFLALGVDPFPEYPATAVSGYLASMFLGIGMGAVNIGIASFFPGWLIGFIVIRLLLYLTCGVFFLPSLLPEQIYMILRWNPLVQIVEWVRSGFFPEMDVQIDYLYVLMVAGATLVVGLLMERFVVRRAA